MKKRNRRSEHRVSIYLGIVALVSLIGHCAKSSISDFYKITCDKIANVSGFQVREIKILGASPRIAHLIRSRIKIRENDLILSIPTAEIYNQVTAVSWVKDALVKKNLPNILSIEIEESIPIAVYQQDAKSFLIDGAGKFLEEVSSNPANLPLVSGQDANKKVREIIEEISKFRDVRAKLEALTYVRKRRWDIVVSGVKVKLPEDDVNKALSMLDTLVQNDKLNKTVVHSVDLRLPGQIILNGLQLRNVPTV